MKDIIHAKSTNSFLISLSTEARIPKLAYVIVADGHLLTVSTTRIDLLFFSSSRSS
jgi:hypothetical protein